MMMMIEKSEYDTILTLCAQEAYNIYNEEEPLTYYYNLCCALCYAYKQNDIDVFRWLVYFMDKQDYNDVVEIHRKQNDTRIEDMIKENIDIDFWEDNFVLLNENVPQLVQICKRRMLPKYVTGIMVRSYHHFNH